MEIEKTQLNAGLRQYLEKAFEDLAVPGNELVNFDQTKNAIITKFGDLKYIDACSKRLPIISDRNLFLEKFASPKIQDNDYSVMKSDVVNVDWAGNIKVVQTREEVWFKTNNYQLLESWFTRSNHMLDSKKIVYAPTFEKIQLSEDIYIQYTGENPGESLHDKGVNLRVLEKSPLRYRTPFRAITESDVEVNDPTVIPLINLEIPGFENVTPSQLSRLMDDHPDKLLRFRNNIQRRLLEFESGLGSGDFAREIRLVELDLQEGVMRLKDDTKKLEKTTAVEIIGAQAITWTLHIFVFLNTPNELLKVILPGGALAAVAATYAKYLGEKLSLGNDPLSFLLLISKKAKKI